MGRFAEGVGEIQKALELDPLSLIINADAGWFFSMAGQGDRALTQLSRTIELEPRFAPAYLYLGEVYLRKGMYQEAIASYKKGVELGDGRPAVLGFAYGRAGRKTEAMRIIEELSHSRDRAATSIAIVYAGIGDNDRALALLEEAYREHSDSLIYLRSQPLYDPLRSDPRFQNLLSRMNFPQ
jgi:tetratricopeptide (TPR) repeat protein